MPGSVQRSQADMTVERCSRHFSVIAKNTNPQEKEHFLAVIRETLEGLVKKLELNKKIAAGRDQ